MEKIKPCKICGRIDFKENGEYLVCRTCGETRIKYPFPLKQFCLLILFFICGAQTTFLGILVVFSGPRGSSGPQRPFWSAITGEDRDSGLINGFDFFIRGIEDYILLILPLIWIFAIVFWILMALCAKSFFSYFRKKKQAEELLSDKYRD